MAADVTPDRARRSKLNKIGYVIGAVTCVFWATVCGMVMTRRKGIEPARNTASSESYVPNEIVQPTLPLELGEGSDRTTTHEVVFVSDGHVARLVAGTRVERLLDRGGAQKRPTKIDAKWVRIRVRSGPYDGQVAYVHPMFVQGAR